MWIRKSWNSFPMNNDTSCLYAIFYSFWRMGTWGLKSDKSRDYRRSSVRAKTRAERLMGTMILLNLSFFVCLIGGYLETIGFNFKWSILVLLILCLLFVTYLDFTVFEEKRYRKYLIQYDKRDSSWKRKWCIISIVYVLFSYGCLILGIVISDYIRS